MGKNKQKVMDNLPAPDEVGRAAEALIEADKALLDAKKRYDDLEVELFQLMRKHKRQNMNCEGYRFSLRIRPTREIVAVSRPV